MTRAVTRDVADIMATELLETLREGRFATEVLAGGLEWTLLRDLSRARYISPLRRRLSEGGDDLRVALLTQLNVLSEVVRTGEGDRLLGAAAAAVFLVRITKRLARENPTTTGDLRVAARALFTALASTAQDYPSWKELLVELALQLAADEEAGQAAVELLLGEQQVVEEVRYRYFETRSMSELYQRMRARWDAQGLEQYVSVSLAEFGGLSPFLHTSPAPGGAGDAVLLVGQFARALEEKEDDKRRLAMEAWITSAGRTQRLIQWELCSDQDGEYVALGSRGKLATLLSRPYLSNLTVDWWRYVVEYEPVPLGRPVKRLVAPVVPGNYLEQLKTAAEMTLKLFQETLDAIGTVAAGRDIHAETATRMLSEWSRADRAGVLLVHDGELTFDSLRWLRCDGQWHHPVLSGGLVVLSQVKFADFLGFLGLGYVTDGEVLLTPRWRSFVRWLTRAKGDKSVGVDSLSLNRAPIQEFEARLTTATEAWLAEFGALDWTTLACRVPLLPSEVFLRAYRPWPSHLLVSTIHATRQAGEIRPLSFGFATVVGDLPNSGVKRSLTGEASNTPRSIAVSTTGEGEARFENDERTPRILHSWVNSYCSTLAGIGMTLGVSSEMAKEVIDQRFQRWRNLIWPEFTRKWFAPGNENVPHNVPSANHEGWATVLSHLRKITDLQIEETRWDNEGRLLFWNEMKAFFGEDARVSGGRKNPLSLNGLLILLAAFHKATFTAAPGSWPLQLKEKQQAETVTDEFTPYVLDRQIASRLLVGLFEALLRDRREGKWGKSTLDSVSREPGGLRLRLTFPFSWGSVVGRRSLWSSLLAADGGGDSAREIRSYHNLLRSTKSRQWIPGELLVVPAGSPQGSATDLLFTCGRATDESGNHH